MHTTIFREDNQQTPLPPRASWLYWEDTTTRIDLGDHDGVSLGYRTVEGGADVSSVYNFAWIHYAVATVWFRF